MVDEDHVAAAAASLKDLTRCIDVITVTAVVHFGRREELVTRLAAALRAVARVAADLGLDFCLPAAGPPVERVQDALRELGTELSAVRCAVRCQIDSDMVTLAVTGTRLDATAQWIMAIAAFVYFELDFGPHGVHHALYLTSQDALDEAGATLDELATHALDYDGTLALIETIRDSLR
jgi:hypothetical protein